MPSFSFCDEPKDDPKDKPDIKGFFPKAEDIDKRLKADEYTEYEGMSLFDYIDGGAEIYIDLGFIKVGALDYILNIDDEEYYFTLDIYDMKERINAFGLYAAERYGDLQAVNAGVEGYIGGGALNFWAKQFYVKIRADDDSDEINDLLKKFAEKVSTTIGDKGDTPEELALFPSTKNKVKASEKYFAKNLLGLSYLKGFSCQYATKKEKLKLVIALFDSDKEAMNGERLFLKRLKSKPLPAKNGEGLLFTDKYLGNGRIMRIDSYISIVTGLSNDKLKDAWTNQIIDLFYTEVEKYVYKKKSEKALKSMIDVGK